MCECLKKEKERLKTELPAKNKSYSNLEINKVTCDSESIIYGEDDTTFDMITIPFTLHHQNISKGKKPVKTTGINLMISYCPLCGEKQPE